MKKSKQIGFLQERVEALEKIIKKDGIYFTNPDNENSTVFMGIRDNSLITEGVIISQSVVQLPINNQKLID